MTAKPKARRRTRGEGTYYTVGKSKTFYIEWTGPDGIRRKESTHSKNKTRRSEHATATEWRT